MPIPSIKSSWITLASRKSYFSRRMRTRSFRRLRKGWFTSRIRRSVPWKPSLTGRRLAPTRVEQNRPFGGVWSTDDKHEVGTFHGFDRCGHAGPDECGFCQGFHTGGCFYAGDGNNLCDRNSRQGRRQINANLCGGTSIYYVIKKCRFVDNLPYSAHGKPITRNTNDLKSPKPTFLPT